VKAETTIDGVDAELRDGVRYSKDSKSKTLDRPGGVWA
jgi:hypothetical protein